MARVIFGVKMPVDEREPKVREIFCSFFYREEDKNNLFATKAMTVKAKEITYACLNTKDESQVLSFLYQFCSIFFLSICDYS